jgi:hypothetical protein
MIDSVFKPIPCRRCGTSVLNGLCAGLTWRMDRREVPPADARILKTYGVTLLVLTVRLSGLHPDIWEPDVSRLDAYRFLVAPHVCGSAHAQRSKEDT